MKVDWVDLPEDSFVAILGYETQNTIELDALVKKYNGIPKDQVITLSCRIRKLEKIIDFIQDWTTNRLEAIDKKKHLIWIFEIATKKRNYLVQLLQIYEQNLYEDEALNAYHTDISSLKNYAKTPVFLTNHRFFSLKMREYWGDFWFETVDPCHRRLTTFLDQWRALKKTNPEIPHFFLWLETQHIPKYVPCVTHLKEEMLEKTKVNIKDGLFVKRSESDWVLANFCSLDKRYLFAIDLKEEIYVAEEENGISHSSFTSGKPVLGAGLLQIKEGVLVSLALESGHYMPSMEIGYQILKIFSEKGALFPNNLEVVFFHDRNKYKVEFAAQPLPPFEEFKEILSSAYADKKMECYESSTV